MKKVYLNLLILLCMALLLSSCAIFDPLPEEYKEGERVPKEYPDEQLEIYDDAIVFEADKDEDKAEINLKFGTEDDIDDVIEFYEDFLEENNLIIEEMDSGRDEFYAKGTGEGFSFEIEIEEPKGNYEERAFSAVGEIKTFNMNIFDAAVDAFVDGADTVMDAIAGAVIDQKIDEALDALAGDTIEFGSDENTLDKLQGFWQKCGEDDLISDMFEDEGIFMIIEGDSMVGYKDYELIPTAIEIELKDDNTLLYTSGLSTTEYTITFSRVDGVDLLILTAKNGSNVIYRKITNDEVNDVIDASEGEGVNNAGNFGDMYERIQGPWVLISVENGKIADMGWGDSCIEFDGLEQKLFTQTVHYQTDEFIFTDEDTIIITHQNYSVDLSIEVMDGVEVLVYKNLSTDYTQYYRRVEPDKYDNDRYLAEMYNWDFDNDTGNDIDADEDIAFEDYLNDKQLEELLLADIWYSDSFLDGDGEMTDLGGAERLTFYDSGMAAYETGDTVNEYIWHVYEGRLILEAEDGSEVKYILEYERTGQTAYLYIYDKNGVTAVIYKN